MKFVVDEKPEFTVSASAYTSYSKYRSYCETNGVDVGLLNEANACDGSTMYDIRCSVNISDAVIRQCALSSCVAQLSNKNGVYSQASNSNGTAFTSSPNFYSLSKFPNLPWGEYTLRSEVTFDGVTRSTSKTFHVTGLPYKADPPSNSGHNPWSGSAYSWNGDYVRLHKHTISQTFNLPADVNVNVAQNVRIYTRADDCVYTLILGGNEVYRKSQSSTGGRETKVNESYQLKLPQSNPVLSCINTYGTADFGLEYTNVRIYEISVTYR